jgi:hypothetical protein
MLDDVEALSLVRECRELEERYDLNLTSDTECCRCAGHHQKGAKDHQLERPTATTTKGLQNIRWYTRSLSVLDGRSCGIMYSITAPQLSRKCKGNYLP